MLFTTVPIGLKMTCKDTTMGQLLQLRFGRFIRFGKLSGRLNRAEVLRFYQWNTTGRLCPTNPVRSVGVGTVFQRSLPTGKSSLQTHIATTESDLSFGAMKN